MKCVCNKEMGGDQSEIISLKHQHRNKKLHIYLSLHVLDIFVTHFSKLPKNKTKLESHKTCLCVINFHELWISRIYRVVQRRAYKKHQDVTDRQH